MHMGFGVGGACQIVLFGKPRNFGASGLLCKNGTKGFSKVNDFLLKTSRGCDGNNFAGGQKIK
jgi:hypothetical protein